ncbi:MAG: ribbon-helix-helix protein, CopG family [Syntrophomonadaceae bacterium]|nr:ribbon-helix-helix protein, CopG family [Syntrophomonadaceae bacterium]
MGAKRRISVSLDERLFTELNAVAAMDGRTRGDLLNEALTAYIEERRRQLQREEMGKGYQEMAALNLKLADENL